MSQYRGHASIRGPNESVRMALLTCSLVGMVFVWSLEMSYCTPYLLSLGLTKSFTSLIWIVGPLSSLIIQPIVGALADRSTSRFGRRRPFMLASSWVVGCCLLVLGWAPSIVSLLGLDPKGTATIVLAVFSIYGVDIAINVLQASSRGLIVDTLSREEQQTGAAWDARMGASGHIIAYFIGTLDLVSFLPGWFGGDTQFKKMCVVAALAVWIAVGTTSWAVSERVLLSSSAADTESIRTVLSTLWARMRDLPPRIQAICRVQFWSWIGWFPFLFYGSTWVGETYFRYEYNEARDGPIDDVLGQVGRLGSTALVLYSFVTFGASLALPNLVQPAKSSQRLEESKFNGTPPSTILATIQAALKDLKAVRPRLVTAWICSELFFAAVFVWAPFVRSLWFASLTVALAGIPWTVTVWAPLAEMGVEIDRLASGQSGAYDPVGSADLEEEDSSELWQHNRESLDDPIRREGEIPSSSTGKLSGIYLGVLNAYTTLPQFVGTAISWVVFSIFEPKRSTDPKDAHKWLDLKKTGPNAIAICLFVGAASAGIASWMAWKLRKIS
jgi:solute carrier family 45, member 1/2/4